MHQRTTIQIQIPSEEHPKTLLPGSKKPATNLISYNSYNYVTSNALGLILTKEWQNYYPS